MAPDCFDIFAPVEILSAEELEAVVEECDAHQKAYDWQNPFRSGVEAIPSCCELSAKPWPVVHWCPRKGTGCVHCEKKMLGPTAFEVSAAAGRMSRCPIEMVGTRGACLQK